MKPLVVLGVIIAGGRSERFGSHKALANVDGQPMIGRVLAALQAGCARVAVNAPADGAVADWARAEGLAVLPDPVGLAEGPLAGVVASLAWAQAQGAALLATAPCDMPWLPVDLVRRLAANLGDEAGAAMAVGGGDRHPLCAVWRVARRGEVAAMMTERRHPSMRGAMTALAATEVAFDDPRAFANVNAVEDLERYFPSTE